MKNKVLFSVLLGVLLSFGGLTASAPQVDAAACIQQCMTECEDAAQASYDACYAALDPQAPDFLDRSDDCDTLLVSDYDACPDHCDSLGLPGTCPAPPITVPSTTTKPAPGAGWMTLVPFDCQDANGCDICEVTKVFTNGANIIAAALSTLALLMFIIGGLYLVMSAGNEQRVTKGKQILVGTVTGIAIVFLAWFAVNVIVRTAASSGGAKASGSLTTSKIFSSDWWNLTSCYPDVPTICKGLKVGAACGTTNDYCTGGKTNNAVCTCYRRIDALNGDSATCGSTKDDATAVTAVDDVAKNATNKQCMCIDPCARYALYTKADYKCVPTGTAKNADGTIKAGFTIAEGIACGKPNTICALTKTP